MAITTVHNELIAVNAISGTAIADNAVTSVHIALNNITTVQLALNSVTSVSIALNQVTGTQIANNAITSTQLADNAVTATKVPDGTQFTLGATTLTGALTGTTGAFVKASSGGSATVGTVVTIEDDDNTELSILGGSSSLLAINFGHSGDNNDAIISYNTTSGSENMAFTVSAAERMRITGNNLFLNGGTDARIQLGSGGAGANTVGNDTVHVRGDGDNLKLMAAASGGLFYEENGTARFSIASGGAATFSGEITSGGVISSSKNTIQSNGRAAWSANGMGDHTATPSRDFAFYTEGSTNGLEVRSNDYRLVMIGAGGSSGTGSDDGYVSMSSQNSTKIAFNANGASYFNGGNVGIGEDTPTANLHIKGSGGGDGVHMILQNTGNAPAGVRLLSGHGNWEMVNSKTVADMLEFVDDSAGVTRMCIKTDGNVGIGTTSPGTALEISRTSTDQTTGLILENLQAGGYGSGIIWESKRSDDNSVSDAARIHVSGTNSWNSNGNRTSAMSFGLVGDGTFAVRAQINKYNGIAFGTDSSSANTLNDYEQGTFVANPTISGASGAIAFNTTNNHLSYTKIGNIVHIQGTLQIASNGVNGGRLNITNLPFTSASHDGLGGQTIMHAQISGGTGSQASGYLCSVGEGTTTLQIQTYTGVGTSNDSAITMAADSFLLVNGTYLAA